MKTTKLSATQIAALGALLSAPQNKLHGKDGWVNGNTWHGMKANELVTWDRTTHETTITEKGRQAFAVGRYEKAAQS